VVDTTAVEAAQVVERVLEIVRARVS